MIPNIKKAVLGPYTCHMYPPAIPETIDPRPTEAFKSPRALPRNSSPDICEAKVLCTLSVSAGNKPIMKKLAASATVVFAKFKKTYPTSKTIYPTNITLLVPRLSLTLPAIVEKPIKEILYNI